MKKIFKKIRLPKLPKEKTKRLAVEILISLIGLIILIVIIYGLGIYKYHWSRYGVKAIIKIIPYPAALVGPSWISMAEFDFQKSLVEHFYKRTNTPLPEESGFNRQIIDQLIEQKLIGLETRKLKIYISRSEIDKEERKIIEENQGEENVGKMLEDLYDISLKKFRNLIAAKLIAERFRNEALVSVHLKHILIKDEARANDVLNQLKTGTDFDELAKKFSEDEASRDKGGDLGWLQRGGLVSGKPMSKEFETGVFSVNVGQISSAPVLTEFGYHIFKVIERKGKIDKSYNDWLTETKNKTRVRKFVGN